MFWNFRMNPSYFDFQYLLKSTMKLHILIPFCLALTLYQVSASIQLYCAKCTISGCQSGLCVYSNGGSLHNHQSCYQGDPSQCVDTPIYLDTEKCSRDATGASCNSGCCMIISPYDLCLKDEFSGACDFVISIGLIIGIVVGVLVLGGIIGFIVYRKRKSSLGHQTQDSNQGIYNRA